jgi:hypothetical protein
MDNNNNSIKFNILMCKLNSTSACCMASTKTQNTKTVQIHKSKNTKHTKQEQYGRKSSIKVLGQKP